MIPRVQARINLKALQHNFQIARNHSGTSKVMAVIKANAYGHGLLPAAEALSSADLYAVTDINEAEQLKASGTDKDILILQGLIDKSDIRRVAENNFQIVIASSEHLHWLDEELTGLTLKSPLTFWLKLDSGMGRLGLTCAEYCTAFKRLQTRPYTKDIIMMTHLANSSLPDSVPASTLNEQQLAAFIHAETELAEHVAQTSIPSSSGILSGLHMQSDWTRPGIMLYGSSPFPWEHENMRRQQYGLQAVMTLESKLIATRDLKAGDNVGYSSQFICPHDMRIGIVSTGYADGYPSCAPNGTPVLVNGVRTQTCGRVSMDMLAVDISNIPTAAIGSAVTLWGDDLSLDEVAAATGILSYNLTCSVARRVNYIYT